MEWVIHIGTEQTNARDLQRQLIEEHAGFVEQGTTLELGFEYAEYKLQKNLA